MNPLAPIIDSVLKDLTSGVKETRSLLQGRWPELVGEKFSRHTRPAFQQNILTVWVDDSVLAYELSRRYQGTILKRVEQMLGEGSIKKIIFRVGEV